MLHFVHRALVDESSDSFLTEYACVSLVLVAAVQIGACLAVRSGRPQRAFEAASGASVALVCVVTLLMRGTYFPRQVLVTLLMVLWGVRLSWHLYTKPVDATGQDVAVRTVWAVTCAMPAVTCTVAQHTRFHTTRLELACAAAALLSILLEAAADVQKQRWHRLRAGAARPDRSSSEPPVCADGLWALSRHPNVFFELVFHWAVYLIVRPVEAPWVVVCPILLSVFVFLLPGGVASMELERSRLYGLHLSYLRYRDVTPVLFPLPWAKQALADRAPHLESCLCLELPVFQ